MSHNQEPKSTEGNPLFDTDQPEKPSITLHALEKERRRLIRKKDALIAKFPNLIEAVDKEIDKIDGDIITVREKELEELITNRALRIS